MNKLRVMLVDDSLVVRRLVTDVINADPALIVAGVANTGEVAIQKISTIRPHVIVMDVEMPDMDGLTALKEIRKRDPKVPVIMFSTLTGKGAVTTLDALANGANDYVQKPSNVGGITQTQKSVRDELLPKIKALGGLKMEEGPLSAEIRKTLSDMGFVPKDKVGPKVAARKDPPRVMPSASGVFRIATGRVDLVVIGVSTGGPNALETLFSALPKDFPAPILIVQHMPPMFTRLLAERLSAKSAIPVHEAKGGEILVPGQAWLAPGDFHMVVRRTESRPILELNQSPPQNFCRPAVDPLFKSAAECYGANILGVILTGMGQDGTVGCRAIKDSGGTVICQDEETSVVWGMPGFVAQSGLADEVLPLDQIASKMVAKVTARRAAPVSGSRTGGSARPGAKVGG